MHYPALIEHPDGEGAKPVHYAAMNGETNMLNFLISKGANIMVTDFNGETPLHLGIHFKKQNPKNQVFFFSRSIFTLLI